MLKLFSGCTHSPQTDAKVSQILLIRGMVKVSIATSKGRQARITRHLDIRKSRIFLSRSLGLTQRSERSKILAKGTRLQSPTPVGSHGGSPNRKSTGPVTGEIRAFMDCYLKLRINLVHWASELGAKFMLAFPTSKGLQSTIDCINPISGNYKNKLFLRTLAY